MTNLFDDQTWTGEFFLPNKYEERFPGKIDYSPEKGVTLRYAFTEKENHDSSEIIHGVVLGGHKCTLIGKFDNPPSLPTLHNGLRTHQKATGFQCLAIGGFLEPDELFYNASFTLLPMQEFFFPAGFKDWERYSEKPLMNLETSYGLVSIWSSATFNSLPEDITTQIHCLNDKLALEALKTAFDGVREQYPDAHFMLKRDISYKISVDVEDGATIEEIFLHISGIADLFSLLIYYPVHPEFISVQKRDKKNLGQEISLQVFPSMGLNKSTIDLCHSRLHHLTMPISKRNIDLQTVVANWLKDPKKYSSVVSGVQYDTGFYDELSLLGDTVLYVTQFESISHLNKQKNDKYGYPLQQFASDKIRNKLQSLFPKTDLGVAISDLRNEIAHIGRPKKILSVLSMKERVEIAQCMQLTVIGYILKELGVADNVIEDYQDSFCP